MKKPWIALVGALLISTLSTVGAQAEDRGADCEKQDRAWLEANSHRLPHNYDDILAFSADERRLALRHVDAQVQSDIWRAHMQRYLAVFGNSLTAEQQALVHRGIDLASPLLFSFKVGDPGRAVIDTAIGKFKAEAQKLFPEDQIVMAFLKVGSVDDTTLENPSRFGFPSLACNCSSHGDCYIVGGGACAARYCRPVYGCGYWADEVCAGRCG